MHELSQLAEIRSQFLQLSAEHPELRAILRIEGYSDCPSNFRFPDPQSGAQSHFDGRQYVQQICFNTDATLWISGSRPFVFYRVAQEPRVVADELKWHMAPSSAALDGLVLSAVSTLNAELRDKAAIRDFANWHHDAVSWSNPIQVWLHWLLSVLPKTRCTPSANQGDQAPWEKPPEISLRRMC